MAWPLSPEATVSTSRWGRIGQLVLRLAVCIITVLAIAALEYAAHATPTTAALSFLIPILTVSTVWGVPYAIFLSIISDVAFDYVFVPPFGSFYPTDRREWVALCVFLITGIIAGQLADRARREALEANKRRTEAVAAQQRFSDLVNSVEGIVWEADAETFVFSFVSDQAERVLGYPKESWLNEPTFWKDHLHPQDRDWVVQSWGQAKGKKRNQDFEYRMIAGDGRVVWLRDLVTVVVENGHATRLRGVMIDITARKRAEEAARRSETELRDVINTVPANAWSASTDGAVDFVNQRWQEFTGLPPEDALGWKWETAVHPDDRSGFVNEWHAALKNGQAMDSEVRVRRGDGEYRWLFIRNVPVRDELGNIRKWYGTGIDIEDRKRAADTLRQTEAILSQAQRLARIGVWVTRSPMIPEYWSQTAFEIFGIDPAEGPPKNLQEFMLHVHPEDRERVLRETDVLETGSVFECKYRIVRPDGAIRVIREVGSPVQESGGAQRFVGAWMDITEQEEMTRELQRREAALQDSEEQWRATFESNPTMYFMVDEAGTILSVNPFGAEQLGYGVSELVGQPVLNVFVEPDRAAILAHANDCFQQLGRTRRWEARKIRKDGTMLWVRETANAVLLKKHPVLLVVCEDITEQKRAEEALHVAMSARMRLAAFRAELGSVLAHQEDLKGTLHHCAEAMVRHLDAAFARVWTLSSDGRELQLQASAGMYTRLDGSHSRIPFGQLKIGLIAKERKPHLTNNVQNDPRVNDKEWAQREKMISFAGYPLMVEDRVVGVMGMFSQKPLPESTLEALSFVADAMAQVIDRKRAEEALRRSEAYLAEAQRLSHTGSWAHDLRNDRTIYWSEEMFRIHGFDPKDGLPSRERLWQMFHPEDLKVFRERYANAVQNHEKDDIVLDSRLVMPDGSLKYMRGIGHPILNDGGEIIEFRGTVADVTEQKKAEEALRRSEAYLAEAQRLSKTGSWAWDPHSDTMLYCSEEIYRIFAVDPQERVPSTDLLLQRVHPEDRERVRAESVKGGRDKTEHSMEYRLLLPDRTIRYVLSKRRPVFDGAGEIVEIIGTIVDVTERKRAEELLRASEGRFRTSVDHLTDALFIHDDQDDQGRVIDVNQQACDSLGYTREELIGMTAFDYDPRLEEAVNLSIKERLARGEIFSFESVHRRKNGTEFPVEVRVRPFWHGDRRFGLALVRDIADRKRAEAEREKLRQLEADLARINRITTMGELTASLAHEINQPIAAAVTDANTSVRWLARENPNIEEAREAAKRAANDATRAAEIITRIRSLFKKGTPQRELVDLNEVIEEMIPLLRNEAAPYGVSIQSKLAPDLPQVMADRVQVQQVLMNLMLNSIEAMKGVDTPRKLTLTSQRDGSDQLLVSVSDTGTGLPPEPEQIFHTFFTTKPHGTGMGLAISRTIIESHGGRLWATSNSGPGAIFHFTLPTTPEAQ